MKTKVLTSVLAILLFASTGFGADHSKGKNFNLLSNFVDAKELTLKIEPWMTDESVWNLKSEFGFTEEADQELDIELWMVHQAYWENFATEADEIHTIEKWMTDESNWNPFAIYTITEIEKPLLIEDWMIDSSFWK